MSTGHPTAIALDALAHALDEDPAIVAHVETCARCRGIVETTREDAARFTRSVLPRTVDVVAGKRPRFSWMWGLAPALALVPLLLWLRLPKPLDPAMTTRVEQATPVERQPRATAKLSVFAQAAGQGVVRELDENAPVVSGELVRFTVEEQALPYVVVLSIDARGGVTVRAPIDGGSSIDVGTTGREDLPGSWLVEPTTAPVQIVALFSSRPLDSEAMRRALETGALPLDVVERRLHLARKP